MQIPMRQHAAKNTNKKQQTHNPNKPHNQTISNEQLQQQTQRQHTSDYSKKPVRKNCHR